MKIISNVRLHPKWRSAVYLSFWILTLPLIEITSLFDMEKNALRKCSNIKYNNYSLISNLSAYLSVERSDVVTLCKKRENVNSIEMYFFARSYIQMINHVSISLWLENLSTYFSVVVYIELIRLPLLLDGVRYRRCNIFFLHVIDNWGLDWLWVCYNRSVWYVLYFYFSNMCIKATMMIISIFCH
jgi:hypothetical protein